MADNDNLNQDQNQEQDPFEHPVRRNNWWLYIFGGLVFVGIIIWFFVDWSYKNRDREPIPVETQMVTPQVQDDGTLPQVTVDAAAPSEDDSVPADAPQP